MDRLELRKEIFNSFFSPSFIKNGPTAYKDSSYSRIWETSRFFEKGYVYCGDFLREE
jgi:hypothetical protein